MPRYHCDYCDTYLTHDSPSVRKQHNAGYKHKGKVRDYYQQFQQELSQAIVDQMIQQSIVNGQHQLMGAAYNPHLGPMPGQRPPVMPYPRSVMPLAPNQMMPIGMRPPLMPMPVPGAPPNYHPGPPSYMQPMALPPDPPQMNGLPQAPMYNPAPLPPVKTEPATGAPQSFIPLQTTGAPHSFVPAPFAPPAPIKSEPPTSGALHSFAPVKSEPLS